MLPNPTFSFTRACEVLRAFLVLGLTSFGGPIAHLAYFRTEFVERRAWLNDQDYADLVALCQFLPGPASSQVGFALGLMRAGPLGAAFAWLAFTLPSTLLLLFFALGLSSFEGPFFEGILHGLKIVAVAIIAHALWGMAFNLCPDRRRVAIALGAAATVILWSGPLGQVSAIVLGGCLGWLLCKANGSAPVKLVSQTLLYPVSHGAANVSLLVFAALLLGLPVLAWVYPTTTVVMADAFYRAGALVFGGGHVVLPLLEAEVVQSGWVSSSEFVAGYGAAQAVPGPLFTFAAFLGASINPEQGPVFGAFLSLVMIFLSGLLLLVASLYYWNGFKHLKSAQALMKGANAAVVGILSAAFYSPVWTSAVVKPTDFLLALSGFLLLSVWKLPAWVVVVLLAGAGVLVA